MNRGFENAAKTQPLAVKGRAGFAEGVRMATERKHPTDKAVSGTTNDGRTGKLNPNVGVGY